MLFFFTSHAVDYVLMHILDQLISDEDPNRLFVNKKKIGQG